MAQPYPPGGRAFGPIPVVTQDPRHGWQKALPPGGIGRGIVARAIAARANAGSPAGAWAKESTIMERGTIRTLTRPAAVAVVTVVGLAVAAVAGCGSGTTAHHPRTLSNPMYKYYRSMMGRYHGG